MDGPNECIVDHSVCLVNDTLNSEDGFKSELAIRLFEHMAHGHIKSFQNYTLEASLWLLVSLAASPKATAPEVVTRIQANGSGLKGVHPVTGSIAVGYICLIVVVALLFFRSDVL